MNQEAFEGLREAFEPSPLNTADAGKALRKTAVFQDFPLFAGVSHSDCQEIVSLSGKCKFSRGQTVFQEGDPIRNVFLLTSGNMKITRFAENGTKVILRLVGYGELVAITGFSEQCNHCSTAEALSNSTAFVWDTKVFETITTRFRVVRRNLLNIVSQQLQELEERYREVSLEKVATRLSRQLVRLSTQAGRRTNGTDEIKLSREGLAQLTGTTLYTVSRLLSQWNERGVVVARRQSVSVQDMEALRELGNCE
jgi:CRP/FNR family transcriptional regulator, nitrogen oxide reductase regulator